MIHRAFINQVARRAGGSELQVIRQIHKGQEATPPMRFMSMPERFGLYFFICGAFVIYPTSVLMRLDNLRPKPDNSLNEEALAERERRIAARH
uniref:Uncharacterized protein n=1 Tax=Panagrolaimus davidi TaxID=227884 RepID=A0A914QM80_9BILA